MSIGSPDFQSLGERLADYCRRYSIPLDYVFEILNDQKVVPMLRGKGMEYNAFLLLQQRLNLMEWTVQKLNLSAQPGRPDQDIGITHRRTGTILIVESKSAVRNSMKSGERSRLHKVPHFKVKCHRSRSNIKLASTSNDRYRSDEFDVLITNPSNALFAGGTIGEELELVSDPTLLDILHNHYNTRSGEELIEAVGEDWRFAMPSEIADADGFIPRDTNRLSSGRPSLASPKSSRWENNGSCETEAVSRMRGSRNRPPRS